MKAYVCECVCHASVSKGLCVQKCVCVRCVCVRRVRVRRVCVRRVCTSIRTKMESGTFKISWLSIRLIYFIASTGQFGQNLSQKICDREKKETCH